MFSKRTAALSLIIILSQQITKLYGMKINVVLTESKSNIAARSCRLLHSAIATGCSLRCGSLHFNSDIVITFSQQPLNPVFELHTQVLSSYTECIIMNAGPFWGHIFTFRLPGAQQETNLQRLV